MGDPLSVFAAEQARLAGILDRSRAAQGFFWDLRRIPASALRRAILRQSIEPILTSTAYQNARARAFDRLVRLHRPMVRSAMRTALGEVKVTIPNLTELADREAARQVKRFLGEVDAANRRNFTRLVQNAARRYRRSPSIKLLGELAEEMRPHLALTPKLSSRIAKKVAALKRAGMSNSAADVFARGRWRNASAARAAAAARHQVGKAVNAARAAAWDQAIATGALPKRLLKRWRDQQDSRVRRRHFLQSLMGWIPYADPYPIFNVLHPPAPEFGCRCYEEVKVGFFAGLLHRIGQFFD